jgi:hypothetical protein
MPLRFPRLPTGDARNALLIPLIAGGLLLSGGGTFLVANALDKDLTATRQGANYPVNASALDPADFSSNNSPSVVTNPRDPSNVVVANRVDTPRFSCALHVSHDGASTWSQVELPIPRGEQPKCYAPDLAFSPDGTLRVVYVTLIGRGNVPHAVWTLSSTDGGTTLSEPTKALGELAFQVRITADPADDERLYLTWLQAEQTATLAFPETGYPIMIATSSDAGTTWSEPQRVSDPARERVIAPTTVAASNGSIYVLYLDLADDRLDYGGGHQGLGGPPYDGFWQLVLARSDDGGTHWEETLVDGAVVPTERFVVFIPPSPSLAVDAARNRVYVAFHDARAGDSDIWVWASDDAGEGFARPVRVNSGPLTDGTQQLPQVDVAPNGRVDIVYYDRSRDPADLMNEVMLSSSIDGGETFDTHVDVSDSSFDSRVGFGNDRDMPTLGTRLGLLSTDRRALAVWTDTRQGSKLTRKQDIVRAVVQFSGLPPLSPEAVTMLRIGGLALAAAGVALAARRIVSTWRLPRITRRRRTEA